MYSCIDVRNQPLLEEVLRKGYSGAPVPPEELQRMAKADVPIVSGTSGYVNKKYGASVFQQLQTASVLFNLLPKFAYTKDGYRAQTTRFQTSDSADATVAVSENGSIPDSVDAPPTQVSVGTKIQSMSIEYSEKMRLLAGTDDDVGFDVASKLERAKNHFTYAIDQALNQDVTTVASTSFESIDRICSSYAEVTNCADVNAGDSDVYSLDRDAAATWTDAYVVHNSGSAISLTTKMLREVQRGTLDAGANPQNQAWYMGADTWDEVLALEDAKVRYSEPTQALADGVGKAAGGNVGYVGGTLYNKPVFVAPSETVTANGDISNIYLLDLSNDPVYNEPLLGIKVLQAPIVAETHLSKYPAHGKLGNEHVLYSAMELECKNFKRQGKIRDLAAVV